MQNVFTGRERELAELNALYSNKVASLVAVKGRRRVGKSRLVEQFAKGKTFYKFTGLAPVDGLTAQDQRDEFIRQLHRQTGLPLVSADDWGDLFALLAREVKTGRAVILFDEIFWMGMKDVTFLPKLKNAWDDNFKKNSKLMLILCSSVSMWFEENILQSTAFFGRISWTLKIDPLPLSTCNEMLEVQGFTSSAHEKLKVLSVTGGIPWYIEQIDGQLTADENIRRQCFELGGVMVDDFNRIFHDMFEKQDEIYKKIIAALEGDAIDYTEIAKRTEYVKSGRLTSYLHNLETAGFISKDKAWSLKTGKLLRQNSYRLSDNYMRFYLYYIAPRLEDIKARRIEQFCLSHLPGWDGIIALQFENLVINNRRELYKHLNLSPENIVFDNPYREKKTNRQKGCQIDFLIQTKFHTVYVIEIKFSKNKIGLNVTDEMREKIEKINLPSKTAVFPVLVHVNGVSQQLKAENYFHNIIDFVDLLGS